MYIYLVVSWLFIYIVSNKVVEANYIVAHGSLEVLVSWYFVRLCLKVVSLSKYLDNIDFCTQTLYLLTLSAFHFQTLAAFNFNLA